MKKLILFVAALVVSCWTVCSAREFDAKLMRFITIVDGKFAPEISGDEAVRMGFSVNDYIAYMQYINMLNAHTSPALTAPQNLFLQAFGVCRNDSVVLDIPLEKALRAGANVEGYYQTLQVLQQTNEMLSQLDSVERRKVVKDMEKKQQELREMLTKYAMEYPDSSAVKNILRSVGVYVNY